MHAEESSPDIEADRWHGEPIEAWRRSWGVPALRIFQRVGSTNDIAKTMADAGAEQGTLVLADAQTRGRGRRGRAWVAPPGSSLSMSMVVRPPTPGAAGVLTLRLGLAAARAIDRLLPLAIGIKWPNDLQADGRKVGGILCEATVVEDRTIHVIAGLGINLRAPEQGWPAELADRAGSLEEATADLRADAEPLEPELVGRVVEEWLAVAADPAGTLSPDEMRQFGARDALRGREVRVDEGPAGEAAGITDGGALRIRVDDGVRSITAGTVRATEPGAGERLTGGEHG